MRKWRLVVLAAANIYILLHVSLWYGYDIHLWGKTAMTGVPALMRGNINAAAVMVFLILLSVLIFGRGFCGWACHIRGILELADWSMRKLGVSGYVKLREKNVLINSRYRWLFRIGALFFLMMPVFVYLTGHEFALTFNMMSPEPWADLPGYRNQLFHENAPINTTVSATFSGAALVATLTLVILFTISFGLNYFYGQGAFCRVLCPYAALLGAVTNLSPFQRRITRVNQCTGCRKCSDNCPQGIDVSREIYHTGGKVTNRECIKCFTCVDICEHHVLKDTMRRAVPQTIARPEYERKPWINQFKSMQVIEPLGPVVDFISMILALLAGAMASRLGGFWFFVGAVVGFLVIRKVVALFPIISEKINRRRHEIGREI